MDEEIRTKGLDIEEIMERSRISGDKVQHLFAGSG
jgi:hypothetical protein